MDGDSGKVPTLLIDSNVWIDNYLDERPHMNESCALVNFCCAHDIPMLYAVTFLKDVCYTIARELKRARRRMGHKVDESVAEACKMAALSCMTNVADIGTAVAQDMSDVWLAVKLNSIHGDIEDNLIMAAVERSGADYLVTNDEKLIKHSPYPAMTPKDALKMLTAAS